MIILVVLLLTGLPVLPSSAAAEHRKPALLEDMPRSEVMKLWGAPNEKLELEAKRSELWRYKDAEANFHEGKLVSWSFYNAEIPVAVKPEEQDDNALTEETNSENEAQSELEAILDSISGGPEAQMPTKAIAPPDKGSRMPSSPSFLVPGRTTTQLPAEILGEE